MLDDLRGPAGVRLKNCEDNTGRPKYAFNQIQLQVRNLHHWLQAFVSFIEYTNGSYYQLIAHKLHIRPFRQSFGLQRLRLLLGGYLKLTTKSWTA